MVEFFVVFLETLLVTRPEYLNVITCEGHDELSHEYTHLHRELYILHLMSVFHGDNMFFKFRLAFGSSCVWD